MKLGTLEKIKYPLVAKFYKAYYPAGKIKAEDEVYYCSLSSEIAALAKLRPLTDGAFLTAMVTHPDHRNQGLARSLLEYILEKQCSGIYCFASSLLRPIYLSFGFVELNKETLEGEVQALYFQYSKHKSLLIFYRKNKFR